jgi:hypothetical protein
MGSIEFWVLIVAIASLYFSLRSEMKKDSKDEKTEALKHEARHVITEQSIKSLENAVRSIQDTMQNMQMKLDAKIDEIIELLKEKT